MRIHKGDYKRKVEHYLGFGQKEWRPTSLCGGPRAYWGGKRYYIARNWKNVTCKLCLKKKVATP